MPEFAYIARNMQGEKISGVITAVSDRDAINQLSAQSLFPIDVALEKAKKGLSLGGRVGGQLMAMTYSQMAALMRSGVPLLRSLAVLRDQASNRTLKEVLTDVHRRVEDGANLADAMERHPRTFNEMAVNMVRAGGEGGFLEEALERVSTFTEQYEDLKARTAGALAYPVFLGVVGTAVVTVLIVFFVPQFAGLFDRLRERGELPVLTEWLLWFSESIRSYGLIVIAMMVILAVYLRAQLASARGRYLFDKAKIKMPLLGSVFQSLAVARFCRVLGTMLRNGVPILRSLEISRGAASNRVLAEAIENASENISAGQSLARPLAASGHFPTTVVEMISVAEESNTLDAVLVEIADGLEKRTTRRLDLTVRLLEPIMLLVLAGIVLFVVIALLIPVIKMSSALG